MEFKVYQKELELQSRGWIPTFHDISKEVMQIVKASGVMNGTVAVEITYRARKKLLYVLIGDLLARAIVGVFKKVDRTAHVTASRCGNELKSIIGSALASARVFIEYRKSAFECRNNLGRLNSLEFKYRRT